MTKKNVLTIILDSVFVVAFNILFFVNGGTQHISSVWACYGFLHFAYLMVLITPLIDAKGKTAYLSKLTTYTISLIYFFIELIFSIAVFTSEINKIKLIISVQTIITAIYIILLMSNLLTNDSIARKQERHDLENDFIKTISSKAKFIESITADPKLKNRINNLYYSIHSSPTRTSSEVVVYETKITELLEDLETVVGRDSVAAIKKIVEIEYMLNKRNFMIKARR